MASTPVRTTVQPRKQEQCQTLSVSWLDNVTRADIDNCVVVVILLPARGTALVYPQYGLRLILVESTL